MALLRRRLLLLAVPSGTRVVVVGRLPGAAWCGLGVAGAAASHTVPPVTHSLLLARRLVGCDVVRPVGAKQAVGQDGDIGEARGEPGHTTPIAGGSVCVHTRGQPACGTRTCGSAHGLAGWSG